MNKKKKFAFGGTSMNIESPSESLNKIQKASEDALYGAMSDPGVLGLKGLGSMLTNTGLSFASSGLSKAGNMDGIGGFLQDNFSDISKLAMANSSRFATGGTVGTEVEGEEVYETPSGDIGKFFGPKHENGGIKTNLPQGTDIYSERVKVNGISMSDRKLLREKELSKAEKLLSKNPFDSNLKNTVNRLKNNSQILDEKDMAIQNTLHSYQEGMKRAFGGTLDDEEYLNNYDEEDEDFLDDSYDPEEDEELFEEDSLEDEDEEDEEFATGGTLDGTDPYDEILANDYDPLVFKNPLNSSPSPSVPKLDPTMYYTPSTPSLKTSGDTGLNLFGNYSLGDITGMAGSLFGAFSGRRNTIKNREGDTPNINPYKNYGEAGLKTLDSAFDNLDYIKDQNLSDLERSRNAMLRRSNNSTRSINTLRSMNLATDSSLNNSKAKIYSAYADKVNNLLLQKSNKQDARDKMSMMGEGIRDINDRKDRDNFYSNLGADNQSIASGIQNLGKNLNTATERKLSQDALNMLSKYFGVDISADGFKLINK